MSDNENSPNDNQNPQTEEVSVFVKALDFTYDKAINGLPGMDSVETFAKSYGDPSQPLEDRINSLIRWQTAKMATSGFVSGVGGLLTAPVAIPADLAASIFIQLRMITTIAHMCGLDIRTDQVKTLCYCVLCGDSIREIVAKAGIEIGKKVAYSAIKQIPNKVLSNINSIVGFKLITKFGTKGSINLVKIVPVAGGLIGATINGVWANQVGNIARDTFMSMSDIKKSDID